MPIQERFLPGTSWVLGVGYGDWEAGTHVRVEAGPIEGEGDTVWVNVSFPDGMAADVPLEVLA